MDIIFGEDISVPSILYKYRKWSDPKHRKVITDQELYFAKPSTFGDLDGTRECQYSIDTDKLTKENLYKGYSQIFERDNPNSSVIDKEEYAKYWSENSPLNDPLHIIEQEESFFKDLNDILGVLSMSSKWNNNKLWDYFGDNHQGFVIGFDGNYLFEDEEKFGTGGKVNYYKKGNEPRVSPFLLTEDERVKAMISVIYSLPKYFENEDEYRITKMNIKERTVIVDPNAIKEVILGFNMIPNHKKEIVNILNEILPSVELYKTNTTAKGELIKIRIN